MSGIVKAVPVNASFAEGRVFRSGSTTRIDGSDRALPNSSTVSRTDIDNLLPICDRHHHRVHEGGWTVALDAHRNLTITYPDGNIQTTGPPNIRSR